MPGKMVVKQFGPSVDIKISGRDQAASEWQDLKDDFVAVSTTRQVDSPAGAWALTLVSRRDKQGRTWAKRIRPMDYIEIRFGRYKKRGEKPQMVMRGFVDKLSETIGIDGSGKPQRQITISGRDFGKMLLKKQIYILNYTSSQAILAQQMASQGTEMAIFNDLWEHFRDKPFFEPQEFLDRVKKYVFESTGAGDAAESQGGGVGPTKSVANVPELKFTAKDMKDLFVSVVVLKTLQGSVWNLLEHFHGTPACEFLLHDTEEGPELIWRWAPFKGSDGNILEPSTDDGKPTIIDADEIMQYSIETTDNDVWDYYFTMAKPAQMLGTDYKYFAVGKDNPVFRKELIDRYGLKPLEIEFPLVKLTGHPDKEKMDSMIEDWQTLGAQVSKWADKAFSHSARLEGGVVVMRGDERLDIGKYMKIKQTEQEFYIQAIRHDFTLNPPRFTSTVNVSRGLWLKNNPYPVDEGEASGATGQVTGTGSTGDPLINDDGGPTEVGTVA